MPSSGTGPDATGSPERAEMHLVFRLGEREYALALAAIDGLADVGPIRPVRQSPAGVLGLTEWKGQLLTVLDLPALLGQATPNGSASLVRLAPPLDQVALYLPGNLHLSSEPLGQSEDSPTVLQPQQLVSGRLHPRG